MNTRTTPREGRDHEAPGLDPLAVCTLPVAELGDRLAWIRQEILPHAIETARLEHGLAIELGAAPELEEKLDRLIEAEGRCCSGIAFARVPSATPERLRLEIRGVDPDAPMFRSLPMPGTPAPATGNVSRLARSAGIGVVASLAARMDEAHPCPSSDESKRPEARCRDTVCP